MNKWIQKIVCSRVLNGPAVLLAVCLHICGYLNQLCVKSMHVVTIPFAMATNCQEVVTQQKKNFAHIYRERGRAGGRGKKININFLMFMRRFK